MPVPEFFTKIQVKQQCCGSGSIYGSVFDNLLWIRIRIPKMDPDSHTEKYEKDSADYQKTFFTRHFFVYSIVDSLKKTCFS